MKFKFITYLLITIFFVSLINASLVSDLPSDYCVVAEVSDIIPSSIGVNEEFTIGIHIENCGDMTPSGVTFEIINLPRDITVKEELLTEIPQLGYSNSERFLTYHLRTTSDAIPGTYIIKTRLSYGDGNLVIKDDKEITINVIADEAKLDIASSKTNPVLPYKGDTVELTLRIENFGEGIANSVRVYANHSFQGIKESFIGTLDPNEDGPAIFTFITDKSGEFYFPIRVTYKDDFGENEIISNVNIIVLEKKINWTGIILSIFAAICIIWFILHYFKIKKQKNKIIRQLLQENHDTENHHKRRVIKIRRRR